ncbi:serine palmitoyltransferase 1 [Tetranychus urticae]|uniref:Serine palmitoyltransferase 1 n=1 Tax=Tetranychus urticae TaxID=32264 RepID=T1JUB9_TETUR|nr:serine palmitoyltransferase 1 [Tetranychus urticae]XP_025018510.1 serine palmitoyltransferase 1 [Tetranychus urticae]
MEWLNWNSITSYLRSSLGYHILLEAFLLLIVVYLMFLRKKKSRRPAKLSEKEKQLLIDEWKPEPLAPDIPSDHYALNPKIVTSKYGKHIIVDGKKCLNLATHNYLGLSDEKSLEDAALNGLRKYGVGSCGPRGFYGTVDIHLELESRLAKFLNVEEVILYSYGLSAVASAIPAYAKKGDVIFCDEGVHFAIQKGLTASRSTIKYFKHNDVDDLHRLLIEQEKFDNKNPKLARVIRRFLVVEALYMNYGDICPLREMMELKKKYKVRIFVDETVSFGVLGEHGKGITEHLNIPIEDIDHISSTLEHAISGYGGFCAGTTFIIDHQRLSGLGYCFSASLPPLQVAVAIAALDMLENKPDLTEKLRSNCINMHQKLSRLLSCRVHGDPISPVKHLRFSKELSSYDVETEQLEKICDHAHQKGFALAISRYLDEEVLKNRPSIRLLINASLEETELTEICDVIGEAFDKFIIL